MSGHSKRVGDADRAARSRGAARTRSMKGHHRLMPGWLALVLLVTPVLIVAVLGTREVRSAERGRRITTVPDGWRPARGVVVDERVSRRGGNSPGGRRRRPVITFQSVDGREVTFTSRIEAAGMPRPGALIAVYHDPADPTRACIAPEALPDVPLPLTGAARVSIWVIWMLAVVTTVIFVGVLFDF